MSGIGMTPRPVPEGVQVERIECPGCEGAGYHHVHGRTCRTCGGPGIVDWVTCPLHGVGVARSVRTGAFLTGCDGCQAEADAARGWMRTHPYVAKEALT